mgnify:CR=1 FL=1
MTIKDNSIGKKGKKNKKNGECSKSKSKSKGKNKRDDLSTPKSNAYGFKSLRRWMITNFPYFCHHTQSQLTIVSLV